MSTDADTNTLALFRGPRLATNPTITTRIFKRPDSPFLYVSVRGQRIGHVRRNTHSRSITTASQYADLLVRHLYRQLDRTTTH